MRPKGGASQLLKEGKEAQALQILERAVADGDSEAKFQLGRFYFRKDKPSREEAQRSYDLLADATEEGHAAAPHFLGRWQAHYGDYEPAIDWYLCAIERGNFASLTRMGRCYLKGEGVPQSRDKAFEYFERARDAGHLAAHSHCMHMLVRGQKGLPGFFSVLTYFFKYLGASYRWYIESVDNDLDFDDRFRA